MKPQLLLSLKNYRREDLLHDLLAGLLVAIIALPLSIALGIQSVPEAVSERGIQFGLITAIVAGFFIAALGGSRYQIGGPTAAFVVILYGYLSDPDIGLVGLAISGIAAGVILILMGVFRLGNVMKYFPYPITIGFTTGVGITLIVGQIKDFCGFTVTGASVIEKIGSIAENIGTFHLPTFLVGLGALLVVVLLPRLNRKIPAAFAALIIATVASLLLNRFCDAQIATIGSRYGEIRAGFFPPDFSGISSVKPTALIAPSFVIALLCAIESLLSAAVASGITHTEYQPNQELIGQGVANIASSLLGGLPATGAIARTAAGIENGARSPLTGVFHAVFVCIMYFSLMGVMQYVPLCVFAAILLSVAVNMSRFPLFCKLARFGVRDGVVLGLTCVLTVLFDLTYGVIGGAILALLLGTKDLSHRAVVTREGTTVHVSGNLNFINIGKVTAALRAASADAAETEGITLDLSGVGNMDATALEKLTKEERALGAGGIPVTTAGRSEKLEKAQTRFAKLI